MRSIFIFNLIYFIIFRVSFANQVPYIEYIKGELPIIISIPHDGKINLKNIPKRVSVNGERVVYGYDTFTKEVGDELISYFQKKLGKIPFVIINNIDRKFLDANRDNITGAQHPLTTEIWEEFHRYIQDAHQEVMQKFHGGIHIDLHAHCHKDKKSGKMLERIELGYLINSKQLKEIALNDQEDWMENYFEKCSLRKLFKSTNLTLKELLMGENSFGTILTQNGFEAIPSIKRPYFNEPYFYGGSAYNTQFYGLSYEDDIPIIQVEINPNAKKNPEVRKFFSKALADTLLQFLDRCISCQK